MKFLLDTNAVIALLGGDQAFVERLKSFPPADFGISSIVAHERFYGAFRSSRIEANLGRLDELRFEIVAFDGEDAPIRRDPRVARKAGTPISPYDVLIAGQALARDLTVVTHNTRKFVRVYGLRVEGWRS